MRGGGICAVIAPPRAFPASASGSCRVGEGLETLVERGAPRDRRAAGLRSCWRLERRRHPPQLAADARAFGEAAADNDGVAFDRILIVAALTLTAIRPMSPT